MAKQAFPDTYLGSPRTRKQMRGKQLWLLDHAQAISIYESSLEDLVKSAGSNLLSKAQGISSCKLHLGLHYAWDGNYSKASDLLRASATLTHDYIVHVLPTLTSERAPDLATIARDAAAAANLVDEELLSQRLFEHADRSAAALVTQEDTEPSSPTASLYPWGYYPLIRAYSLLRLRRLDGFSAQIFDVPFPEAKKTLPVWQPANIERLLTSVETSVAVGRARRDSVIWDNSERFLLPVLRALAASLKEPGSETAQSVARAALQKYFNMIRNLADFSVTYLLVLDLQKAIPEVFMPVTPGLP